MEGGFCCRTCLGNRADVGLHRHTAILHAVKLVVTLLGVHRRQNGFDAPAPLLAGVVVVGLGDW